MGSSCIYPLLGCSTRPQWRFGGTDIDDKNLEYARRNVAQNNLTSRIRLLKTRKVSPLIPLDALKIHRADFTICNPPFFKSAEDMMATFTMKSRPPSAVCTGAEVEMVTDGGDAGFVLRMVEESKTLGDRVQWYTSMLGKLQSVNTIVVRLKELGINNWAVACLKAGHKTRRWAVAWSFDDRRPRNVSDFASYSWNSFPDLQASASHMSFERHVRIRNGLCDSLQFMCLTRIALA